MNRQLPKLIDELLEIVPKEEESLRLQLDSVKQSALYAAPEIMGRWWLVTGNVLNEQIGNPTTDWHWNTVRLFSGDNSIGPQEKKEESGQG